MDAKKHLESFGIKRLEQSGEKGSRKHNIWQIDLDNPRSNCLLERVRKT